MAACKFARVYVPAKRHHALGAARARYRAVKNQSGQMLTVWQAVYRPDSVGSLEKHMT